MTWLLTRLNVRVATLNATLQLLVLYRYRYVTMLPPSEKSYAWVAVFNTFFLIHFLLKTLP